MVQALEAEGYERAIAAFGGAETARLGANAYLLEQIFAAFCKIRAFWSVFFIESTRASCWTPVLAGFCARKIWYLSQRIMLLGDDRGIAGGLKIGREAEGYQAAIAGR